MRIVMCAATFPPRIGGLEFIAEMIAQALGEAGHEVTVLTREPGPDMPGRAYRLVRAPGLLAAVGICRSAQAAVMLNMSLKMLPAPVLARTPLVVWHQSETGYMADPQGDRKRWAQRHLVAANLGCSDYITQGLPERGPRATVANPYDPRVMFEEPEVAREGDLLLLGRLVSDKGFDVVLRAMAIDGGPLGDARVNIVGLGPEREPLERLAAERGIADRVAFLGPQTGAELRRTLNAHKLLVVPSVWQEPFGIVALEGLACGCSVVVSEAGGLPQAVGAFGRTFRAGDPEDAARVIAEARAAPRDPDPEGRRGHLARHTAAAVAANLAEHLARHARAA